MTEHLETHVDLICWTVNLAIPAVAGFSGIILGAWLTAKRDAKQQRYAFIEQQLRDLYSPLLGLRNEIQALGELRLRVHETTNAVWRKLCEEHRAGSIDQLEKLGTERSKEFTSIIDYDNQQFERNLIPAYRKMLAIFRDNLWLAESETRQYFKVLLEFVQLWERWLTKTLPPEVSEALGPRGESLNPFYEHLQCIHDELRERLRTGNV